MKTFDDLPNEQLRRIVEDGARAYAQVDYRAFRATCHPEIRWAPHTERITEITRRILAREPLESGKELFDKQGQRVPHDNGRVYPRFASIYPQVSGKSANAADAAAWHLMRESMVPWDLQGGSRNVALIDATEDTAMNTARFIRLTINSPEFPGPHQLADQGLEKFGMAGMRLPVMCLSFSVQKKIQGFHASLGIISDVGGTIARQSDVATEQIVRILNLDFLSRIHTSDGLFIWCSSRGGQNDVAHYILGDALLESGLPNPSYDGVWFVDHVPQFAISVPDALGRTELGQTLHWPVLRLPNESDAEYNARDAATYAQDQKNMEAAAVERDKTGWYRSNVMQGLPCAPDSDKLFDATDLHAAAIDFDTPLPMIRSEIRDEDYRNYYGVATGRFPGSVRLSDPVRPPGVITFDISEGRTASADMAVAAYTACVPIGADGQPCAYNTHLVKGFAYYVYDAYIWLHGSPHFDEYARVLQEMNAKWRPSWGVMIEKSGYGSGFAQWLRTQGYGFRLNEINLGGRGKYRRMQMIEPDVRNGRVRFRRGTPWYATFVKSFDQFVDDGHNDDPCDTVQLGVWMGALLVRKGLGSDILVRNNEQLNEYVRVQTRKIYDDGDTAWKLGR